MAIASIFLSHIHEEKEVAAIIKSAIEDEFSGFINVFVSSDGTSIPAGSKFLERIEGELINCSAAIYLISPKSILRSWVNFELGAIWIRSKVSMRNGDKEIPALPFCYAGMTLGKLPQPISSLNSIMATSPTDLEFAFKSLQTALGVNGRLRTNFTKLADDIKLVESRLIEGDKLARLFEIIDPKNNHTASLFDKLPLEREFITIETKVSQSLLPEVNKIKAGIEDILSITYGGIGFYIDEEVGSSTLTDATITVKKAALLRNKEQIINRKYYIV